jgi:hypothetical protein
MAAGGRADGEGVGKRGEAGAEHYLGWREVRGEPVVRADAVVSVFSRHREARFVGMSRGSRHGPRSLGRTRRPSRWKQRIERLWMG